MRRLSKFLTKFVRKDNSPLSGTLGPVLLRPELTRCVLDACSTLKKGVLQDAGIVTAFLIVLALCGPRYETCRALSRFPRLAFAINGIFEAMRP